MISFLNGICADKEADRVHIDVNGVGFEVFVPAPAVSGLLSVGEPVLLYTYLSVREDAMVLYGFLNKDELYFFKKLISVSGIGPKGALGLLSAMNVDDLRFAIVSGDTKSISKAPGIGKKTAERLVLELRDKISPDTVTIADERLTDTPGSSFSLVQDEAVEALVSLGYPVLSAQKAVHSAFKKNTEANTESLLKAALTELV